MRCAMLNVKVKHFGDIDEVAREIIVQAYGEFTDKVYTLRNRYVESKIMENEDFGYYKVVIESPERDEKGTVILKKGKPKPDTSLRDTEDIQLVEDVIEYFEREIKPFNPDSWIDNKKTKIGFDIPFTHLFYKYEQPEQTEVIAKRISEIEARIVKGFEALSGEEVAMNDE